MALVGVEEINRQRLAPRERDLPVGAAPRVYRFIRPVLGERRRRKERHRQCEADECNSANDAP